jgi:hypothetical protein
MPYKDPQRKMEWEKRHHSQRVARRRELRQIEAAWKEAHPEAVAQRDSGPGFLLPVVAGAALAAYNPKLAIGVGGVTLLLAGIYKKDLSWWIVGGVILALGLFFQWNDQSAKK